MTPQELRNSILQLAIQGKLVPQNPADGSAADLLREIQEQRERENAAASPKRSRRAATETPAPVSPEEIPFDIPETWVFIKFSDICTLKDGEKKSGENFPYFEAKYLRGKIEPKIKKSGSYISANTRVILVDGENSGEVFQVKEDGYMGSTFKILSLSEKLSFEYVSRFLQFNQKKLRDNKRGAAIPHLDRKIFFSLQFPLPPLAEQKRIVAKIEELMPLVDRYEKAWNARKALDKRFPEDLQKSLLQLAIQGKLVPQNPADGNAEDLFRQIQEQRNRENAAAPKRSRRASAGTPAPVSPDEIPFDIPETWKWVRLGEIGRWASGTTPSRTNPDFYNGDIPWLKTGDLNDGIIKSTSEKISKLALEKISLRVNPPKSVLMAMYGATIGKLGILEIEATTNQACCACTPLNGIYYKFLFFFLLANRKYFIKKGEGGAQPNISKEKIIRTLFPLPPLAEQKRIVAKLAELLPLCKKLSTHAN